MTESERFWDIFVSKENVICLTSYFIIQYKLEKKNTIKHYLLSVLSFYPIS